MIIADKDDLFVKSLLLESKYKFDREEVSEGREIMFALKSTLEA